MALTRFVEDAVARARDTPADLTRLASEAVPGSLFSGGAGIAFFLLEAARLLGDDDLLAPARRWCEVTRAWAGHASHADWKELPRGFVIGETGLAYVEALLGARSGDRRAVLAAVERIHQLSDRFDDLRANFRATELVGGAAGVACATRDLDARLPRGPEHEAARVVLARVRQRTLAMVLAAHGAALDPAPADALGIAHGPSGELWVLASTLGAEHEALRARLPELAGLREIDEEGLVYWLPSRVSDATHMLGTWCNGMAGHALLWCEIARQTRTPTRESEWAKLATAAAESSSILVSTNSSLCCGLAGHAVALQRYADLSGDARFARRAYARLTRAAETIDGAPDDQWLGLWQGALGVALVGLSRLKGEKTFPCLEVPPAFQPFDYRGEPPWPTP